MATKPSIVRVHLWGREVGAIADIDNKVTFQYHPDYLKSGHSISPVRMPLLARPFENTIKRDAFEGLMGVFADSLPDLYGKKIIQNYYQSKYGDKKYKPSPLHTLMYIGSRGLGALEYRPVDQQDFNVREALDLSDMVAFAKRVIQGDLQVESEAHAVITSIMQSGSLAGGARPKAVIGWDRHNGRIIAGVPPLPEGYEHWLIKFDGTSGQPGDWGKIEFVYSQIARQCGIEMSETLLVRENGRAHFATKRFDINERGERLHMHSLSGLLHSDFNDQRALDYNDFFEAVRYVTGSPDEVRKAFQRLAFNFVGRNCDDHTKNFAFLMTQDGRWRLSPQYDLCFSYGPETTSWVNKHQMTLLGRDEFTRGGLLEIAKRFEIADAAEILERTEQSFATWPQLAREQGVSAEVVQACFSYMNLPTRDLVSVADPSDTNSRFEP